jgi:hypothetical protein
MAVAFVQGTGTNTAGGTAASVSKAFVSNVVAGNCIVAAVMTDSGRAQNDASGWSSTPSNTWAFGSADSDTSKHTNISFVTNAAGGATTVTFTPTSADWMAMAIAEFSGVATSAAKDGASGNTGNTANPQAGAISTPRAGVVLGSMGRHATGTITPGTGWSEIFEDETWDDATISFIYQITSAGSFNPSWTAAAVSWWAAGVALGAASGSIVLPPMLAHVAHLLPR